MNRLIASFGPALVLAASIAAHAAVIVTPLPGVANQSTPQATFFPNDMAVRVTKDGVPLAGVQVDFINIDGLVFFSDPGFSLSGHDAALTDGDGVAYALGLVGFMAGSTVVTVRTIGHDSGSASIPLTVLPGGPTRFERVSGSNQHATVGTTYPQPWVVQAFDVNGNVVPNAAVLFAATSDPTLPSVTFNGSSSVWARADANGFAVSPYFTANNVAGHEEGTAMGVTGGGAIQSAFFAYTNQRLTGSAGGTDGCGRQGKGNGNCGNSDAHSGGKGP